MGTVSAIDVEDVVWQRIDEQATVGEVRRTVARLAGSIGISEARVAEISVAVSELATNSVLHATGGVALVRCRRNDEGRVVELIVIDSGPGIDDVSTAMRDGVSTAGTLGIGLGAIDRIANRFEMFSLLGRGSVTVAAFGPSTSDAFLMPILDGLTRPISGESVCGDAWAAHHDDQQVSLIVADGLGHGVLAEAASRAVRDEFQSDPSRSPSVILRAAHHKAASTRGAAVMAVRVDPAAGTLRCAGVGNIAGRVVRATSVSGMMSQPGIVGQHLRNVREIELPVQRGDLVVVHSDGLTSKWDLASHRGLAAQSPDVIAAVLLREAGLRQDDASVVVLRVP